MAVLLLPATLVDRSLRPLTSLERPAFFSLSSVKTAAALQAPPGLLRSRPAPSAAFRVTPVLLHLAFCEKPPVSPPFSFNRLFVSFRCTPRPVDLFWLRLLLQGAPPPMAVLKSPMVLFKSPQKPVPVLKCPPLVRFKRAS